MRDKTTPEGGERRENRKVGGPPPDNTRSIGVGGLKNSMPASAEDDTRGKRTTKTMYIRGQLRSQHQVVKSRNLKSRREKSEC